MMWQTPGTQAILSAPTWTFPMPWPVSWPNDSGAVRWPLQRVASVIAACYICHRSAVSRAIGPSALPVGLFSWAKSASLPGVLWLQNRQPA